MPVFRHKSTNFSNILLYRFFYAGFSAVCVCVCRCLCVQLFSFTGTFSADNFLSAEALYNIYHIYPILKMPLSGLPAWIAGKGKVPKTRNYTTKNSKLEYQFLDDP